VETIALFKANLYTSNEHLLVHFCRKGLVKDQIMMT